MFCRTRVRRKGKGSSRRVSPLPTSGLISAFRIRGVLSEASDARTLSELADASVIIVHYNGLEQLRRCLDSVLRSDAQSAEVLVVDNASLDSCTDSIGPEYPKVRFVKSPRNLGSSGGWNLGAKAASRDVLVFLNDDVLVPPKWLDLLSSHLVDPRLGAASGLALFLDDPKTINSAGGLLDFLGFGQNRAIGEAMERFVGGDYPRPFYAVGTAFATRRKVWEQSGGFDETMFMYADDLDWSWRIRLLGYALALDEQVVVYHKWRGSGLDLERMVYYLERNEVRALFKNYGTVALAWIAPFLVVVKLVKAIALFLVDRRLMRSVLTAWYWNIVNLRDTMKMRRSVQSSRRVSDRTIVRDMVIGSLELRVALRWTRHPIRDLVGDPSARH
jgi:GT2 family glycosyltransferase